MNNFAIIRSLNRSNADLHIDRGVYGNEWKIHYLEPDK